MLLPVPLVLAVLPAAFAGGGTRRWFGGRGGESQRAEAQAAKDAAAEAFYDLDTAQRDLRISIETINAVDNSSRGRKASEDFAALGRRIDEVSHAYITAVDSHDLDRDDLEPAVASRARTELTRAKDDLVRVKGELDRFAQGLGPLLGSAETQLARLAPAVERARQALLAASNALDSARAAGLRADELAARLAALAPELTKLNQGAGQHGVPETLQRADVVLRNAEAVRTEAERLPERAAEIDRRLVSLRTRAQALTTRAGSVEPVLSELRRRFSAACWQDLQPVPEQSRRQRTAGGGQAGRGGEGARGAALGGRHIPAVHGPRPAQRGGRGGLRRRGPVAAAERGGEGPATGDRADQVRGAGRAAPRHGRPAHARSPARAAARRLRRPAGAGDRRARGRHPDYWHFLTETEAVRQTAARVVSDIREERGGGA